MKEKLGIVFIVVVAALCLFGCGNDLPEEEMVLGYIQPPSSVTTCPVK
ncbi:MAG: hypothetical protein IJD31_10360 [Lachnospiraceae bacterium]|nr:hypothetical protein [Lachnospiraceae bacterium]